VRGETIKRNQFSLQSHQTKLAAINAPLYTIINWPEMLEGVDFPDAVVSDLTVLALGLCALYTNWAGMHPKPAVCKYAMDAARQVGELGMDANEYSAFVKNIEASNHSACPTPNWFL
jgi:hypothetical protein